MDQTTMPTVRREIVGRLESTGPMKDSATGTRMNARWHFLEVSWEGIPLTVGIYPHHERDVHSTFIRPQRGCPTAINLGSISRLHHCCQRPGHKAHREEDACPPCVSRAVCIPYSSRLKNRSRALFSFRGRTSRAVLLCTLPFAIPSL